MDDVRLPPQHAPGPIGGSLAWKSGDMTDQDRWIHQLDDNEISEIEAATELTQRAGLAVMEIEAENFPLPVLARKIRRLGEDCTERYGFGYLRGLPVERYDYEALTRIHWGLSRHLGDPVPQNRNGQAVTLLAGFSTLIVLLFLGFSPTFCGLAATDVVLAVAQVLAGTRLDFNKAVSFIVDGGRDGIAVMIACAAIGIVIASFTSTGLGIKLNQMIVAVGGESLLMALVLAATCSIVLGMGLPTAASYPMVVFVAGPAIMNLGVDKLRTHLFVFYYAVLSAITPPVALAVFAAAAIAKVSPLKLAARALRLSVVAFVLTVVWVYHPEINLRDVNAETWLPTAVCPGLAAGRGRGDGGADRVLQGPSEHS